MVVATGGFGANPRLIEEYYTDAAAAGDWCWYIGCPEARGDGIVLGREVGAAIDGQNRGLLLLTPGFSRDLEIFLPGWIALVDRAGRRFVDETAPYTMMAGLVKRHGGVAFALFDESARAAAAPNPLSRAYWVADVLASQGGRGAHRAGRERGGAGPAGGHRRFGAGRHAGTLQRRLRARLRQRLLQAPGQRHAAHRRAALLRRGGAARHHRLDGSRDCGSTPRRG